MLPTARLDLALELEADRMTNLLFEPTEITSEREVVKEERRLRENAPTGPMHEELGALAFKAHPYQWPVIGWMSDIEGITPRGLTGALQDLLHSQQRHADHCGRCGSDADAGARAAPLWTRSRKDPPAPVRPPEPPQLGEHRAEIPRPTALAAIAMAYHAPPFNHPDAMPLEVLGQILSQGQSSRLYQEMVYNRQMATSISTDADLRIDPGLFTIV